MRPGTLRAYILGVFTGSVVTSAMILMAAPVKADVSEHEASVYSDAVCGVLTGQPTTDAVIGLGLALRDEGYSGYEAGQIIGYSVINACPQHIPVLQRFAAQYNSGNVGQVA